MPICRKCEHGGREHNWISPACSRCGNRSPSCPFCFENFQRGRKRGQCQHPGCGCLGVCSDGAKKRRSEQPCWLLEPSSSEALLRFSTSLATQSQFSPASPLWQWVYFCGACSRRKRKCTMRFPTKKSGRPQGRKRLAEDVSVRRQILINGGMFRSWSCRQRHSCGQASS